MASFRKLAGGKWRAEVARQGVRASKVFPSRQAARDWAARQEYEILHGADIASRAPFREVLERYAVEVSPRKRGERWEVMRLRLIGRDKIADIPLRDLRPADFADWRDRRLQEVAPGSVSREMTLLSGVLNIARKEWGLIDKSPLRDVRKPASPPPRDRLATPEEMERLALSAGDDLNNATARAHHAFLFAIETGMRAGEIARLEWGCIDRKQRVARLLLTKNGLPRDVPLSQAALALLEALPRLDPVFGLTAAQISSLWRKVRDRAGVEYLTFHDARHIAVTRLAKKLDVLDLARMIGHRNINELLTYYNASAADLARRLD